MKKVVLIVSLLLLSACGSRLTLIDKHDGSIHAGKAGGSGGMGEGVVIIDDVEYRGPGVYQSTGGSFSLGNFNSTATYTGRSGMVSGALMGSAASLAMPIEGKGLINMRASNGLLLRCVFSFNEFSNTGIGQCIRSDGRDYDLMLKK